MAGRRSGTRGALGLGLVGALAGSACVSTVPTESETQAKAEASPEPAGPAPAPVDPAGPPAVVGEDAVSHEDPAAAGDPPAWFTAEIVPGAKVMRNSQSKTPEGGIASLLLLELEAGTTTEECIAAAEAKLGETITGLPERTTTPQGYMTVIGETESYAFNVVCGEAKGKPTMYLSYKLQPQESTP